MDAHAPRQHSFTWSDPAPLAAAAMQMDGLSFLRAMQSGELPGPPIFYSLEMSVDELAEGRVVFSMPVREYMYNPIGTVHGGFAATILDSACGLAANSVTKAPTDCITLELKISYHAALHEKTGPIRAIGTVVSIGSRVAHTEAKLFDANDRVYASATSTLLLSPRRKRADTGEEG